MKKIFGIITIGGLHHKILTLVLSNLLVIILIFSLVSYFQNRSLASISENSRSEQQEAITDISESTMHQFVDNSLTDTNALQAYITGEMMSNLKSNVLTMQSLAVGIFEHKDNFEPHPYYPPSMADAGKITAQALSEEGVDIYSSVYLPVAAHMSDTMIAMLNNSEHMLNLYIGLADGTFLCVDYHPENKLDENGSMPAFFPQVIQSLPRPAIPFPADILYRQVRCTAVWRSAHGKRCAGYPYCVSSASL